MIEIYAVETEGLLVARLKGILDAKTAEQVVEFIEGKEVMAEAGFNRVVDLTHLEGIRLSSYDVVQLAIRRRIFNPNDIHVKSAFLATDPLAIGIARMYEQLLQSPRIEVRVWRDKQPAAGWLGVSVDKLTI